MHRTDSEKNTTSERVRLLVRRKLNYAKPNMGISYSLVAYKNTRKKNSTLIHPIYVDIYSDILLNSIATNVIASFLFPSIEFCSDISRLKEKCNIIEQ